MVDAAEIKRLEAKIKEDIKNINILTTIVAALQHHEKSVALIAQQSIRRLLMFYLEKGNLIALSRSKKDNSPQAILQKWLWDIYVSFILEMIQWLTKNHDEELQVAALRTLMIFIGREGDFYANNKTSNKFGNETFTRVIQALLTHSGNDGSDVNSLPQTKKNLISSTSQVLRVLQNEYIATYADVQYYAMKNIAQELRKLNMNESSNSGNEVANKIIILNSLRILWGLHVPDDETELSSFLVDVNDSTDLQMFDDDEQSDSDNSEMEIEPAQSSEVRKDTKEDERNRKGRSMRSLEVHLHAYSNAWIELLRHPLPSAAIYKNVLTRLPDDIMPHLVNPLLLADFLSDSYDLGGVTSLLALNSLYILMKDYNFDYPEFYKKLYELVDDVSLLSDSQRERFFGLLDLFLSSTHLPVYLVAAFAKKFSRMMLVAEPSAIMFLLPMIYNLILRHKQCLVLIHRLAPSDEKTERSATGSSAADQAALRRQELQHGTAIDRAYSSLLATTNKNSAASLGKDPFNSDVKDPQLANAMESSLWEVATMKFHSNAEVVLLASHFEEKLRHQPFDLDDKLEMTAAQIISTQLKRKRQAATPMTFHESKKLFTEDDNFASVFAL